MKVIDSDSGSRQSHFLIAVADIGTRSSHLLIARANHHGYHVLDALKIPTKLGECLNDKGELTAEGEQRLTEAMMRFKELAYSTGAAELRVYATSALREAPNGLEVAQRVFEHTGIYPKIISGEREGELTYLGVAHSLELAEHTVLLDLGGGSLEIVCGKQQQVIQALSVPLGSIRMTRAYLKDGIGKAHEIKALRKKVKETLRPLAKDLSISEKTQFVLSSGTARALANTLMHRKGIVGNINGFSFSLPELASFLKLIEETKPDERHKIKGIEKRADTIVAGLTVLHEALQTLGATSATVSNNALREGMLIEERSRHQEFAQGLSARQSHVLHIAERFRVNLSHAQQVSILCQQLFDLLQSQGLNLNKSGRSLLKSAAMLHEIGLFVSQNDYHKHSAYLIRHVGLLGFSPHEIEMIAHIVRYHRKGLPKSTHPEWAALSLDHQQQLLELIAIFRVAEALDRSRSGGTQIKQIIRNKNVYSLLLQGASLLDQATVKQEADLWQQVFGELILDAP